MNVVNICELPTCEKGAVAFYQQKGVLPAKRVCPRGHDMKLYFGERIQWCCNLRSCRAKVNMRIGNWFQGSRLPFLTSLRFVYYWTQRLTTTDWCHRHLSMANSTTVEWNNYMREVCAYAVELRSTKKIGGENLVVEVDESVFSKRKNHDGHMFPQQCVFGGICRETNDCFLVQVPDRSLKTITAVISKHIAEGSIIYSDSWSSSCVSTLSQNLKANNHRYKFIDSEIVKHTAGITERLWGSGLWRNKKYRGSRHHLDYSYLAEFLWRRQLDNDDAFQAITHSIKTFWPPDTDLIWFQPLPEVVEYRLQQPTVLEKIELTQSILNKSKTAKRTAAAAAGAPINTATNRYHGSGRPLENRSRQEVAEDEQDDDRMFMLSLSGKMKHLSPAENMKFRLEVQQLLLNKLCPDVTHNVSPVPSYTSVLIKEEIQEDPLTDENVASADELEPPPVKIKKEVDDNNGSDMDYN